MRGRWWWCWLWLCVVVGCGVRWGVDVVGSVTLGMVGHTLSRHGGSLQRVCPIASDCGARDRWAWLLRLDLQQLNAVLESGLSFVLLRPRLMLVPCQAAD